MSDVWGNLLAELGLFTLLGVLYYFYQRRKILQYENNKAPTVMGFILQSCLMERGDSPDPHLDPVIEAIDDYLHGKSSTPPTALLKHYAGSNDCSPELRRVIEGGLEEIG